MSINFIDAIPDEKPHCGNCYWFHEKDDNIFQYCNNLKESVPSFGICDAHKKKIKEKNDAN